VGALGKPGIRRPDGLDPALIHYQSRLVDPRAPSRPESAPSEVQIDVSLVTGLEITGGCLGWPDSTPTEITASMTQAECGSTHISQGAAR
jgi:hypothetical protein